jgi:ubiquinone/menaquinone biosynthesis C-methylase UbiE
MSSLVERSDQILMKRVPEIEVMDTEAEAIAYDSMDFGEVNTRFVQDAIALGVHGKILDVGTGTARIPILLAQELLNQQINFQITAIDLASSMLDIARDHLEKSGLSTVIDLQQVDAKQLPYADASFDAVISNSIVHHLSEPQLFFHELARVIKPTSGILIRDLLRPSSYEHLDILVNTYAGDGDATQQKLFRDSLQASYTLTEIEQFFSAVDIDRIHIFQSSDRHWTAQRECL